MNDKQPTSPSRRTRGDFVKNLFAGGDFDEQPLVIEEVRTRFNFDLHKPPSEVPLDTLLRLLSYLHQKFYPTKSFEEACEELGYLNTRYFLNTEVGSIFRVTSRLLGTGRSGDLFVKNLRMVFGWVECRVEYISPTSYQVRVRGAGNVPPSLVKGMMQGGCEAVRGVGRYRVELKILGTDDFTCQAYDS
jgi:uncharacterized protein (TIGR02265 family)